MKPDLSLYGRYLWWLYVALLIGCQPNTGDGCDSSLGCSALGDRFCDRTQPGGYCTLVGCEAGSCPEDAVCVRFRPSELRLSSLYCMAECESQDDCREEEGYRCLSEADFGRKGDMEAEVLDGNKRFCAQPALQLEPPVETETDGGTPSD